jgi:hydrogenase expression/formation protein HypE
MTPPESVSEQSTKTGLPMSVDKILLDHGSGGKASHSLIADLLVPQFENPILAELNDGAIFDIEGKRLAFSTDTYVVDPIFFPGGNIGDLAVNGTVNDLAMCGATPLYLSVGLIIEEGFSTVELKKILQAMKEAATKANVLIVTGDTKVVPNGAADKIFINTSGVGVIPEGTNISGHNARPGDKVIISGTIADHGITVLTQREGMAFESPIQSDTAPLNHLVREMIAASGQIHALRDPTRGGIGTSLNEIAVQSKVGIEIYEEAIPIREEVSGVCELLGFDPLYIANEGKLLAFVAPDHAEKVLATIKDNEYGKDASIIGKVVADSPAKVFMKTPIGGTRIVDMLTGEQLPRIC